eukprot:CAMPEP_0173152752 /NCGR_PEP_ID=MMETSP1105-20130129/12432_1 /TAXON_ID=2985 /ORGANISM="Ochromonas sp., Strain BG-1" /LENGTH=972 /DNA_ID=CAMNT_0014068517 /DNA_START=108 /DNA_END=3026 /DNA_ORIENTATION=+
MGCGVVSKSSTADIGGYKGVLPEESITGNNKRVADPVKQNAKSPFHQESHIFNEKTDISHEIGPPSSSAVTREINFTSGLIFTEALPEHTSLPNTESDGALLDESSIFRMIKKGDSALLREFLTVYGRQRPTHDIHLIQGMWGSSPLMVAIQYNQKDIIDLLLSHLPREEADSALTSFTRSVLNAKNEKGATLFHYAVMEGMVSLIERLLSPPYLADVDREVLFAGSSEGIYNSMYDVSLVCSPFSIAVMNGHVEIFHRLAALAPSPLYSPLPFAVTMKNQQKKLMLKGGTGGGGGGLTGVTSLLLAISYGQMRIIKELLQLAATGSSLSHLLAAADSDGCNLFHYLSRLTTKIDVEESDALSTRFNTTLLSVQIFRLFQPLQSSDVTLLNSRDTSGNTPLHLACEVMKEVELMRLYLENGADASAFNDVSGLTPLHIAVKKRATEVVRCLLDFNADPLATSPSSSHSQQSAYDMAVTQLKDNHPIVLLLNTAVEARRSKPTATSDLPIEPVSHKHVIEDIAVSSGVIGSKPSNDDIDDVSLVDVRGEDEVEEFTPLEESVHLLDTSQRPTSHDEGEKKTLDDDIKEAVAMTSLLVESFLSDIADSPMKTMTSERAGTTTTVEDDEVEEEEDDENELSLSMTSLPKNSPPPPLTITDTEEEEEVKSTAAVSPIQAYLNLNIADITPLPSSYHQKKNKKKKKDKTKENKNDHSTIGERESEGVVEVEGGEEEEDFEDFIESLLGGGVQGSVVGGETIVQAAEQKHVTTSSKNSSKRSPRKPKPPPQNIASTTTFQGRRRSTLKTVTSPPPNNTPSATTAANTSSTTATATAVSVYANPVTPVSPRSKKESDSPKPRPNRPTVRGSIVMPAKKGSVTTLTPRPPAQPKAKTTVTDVTPTASPALVSLIGGDKEARGGGGYGSLADKIKSLTMSLAPADTSDVVDESIELDRLFVGTRPAMPTDPNDERTVRIKR